jgi:hypothetical protein
MRGILKVFSYYNKQTAAARQQFDVRGSISVIARPRTRAA